jgi:hypothetical protein
VFQEARRLCLLLSPPPAKGEQCILSSRIGLGPIVILLLQGKRDVLPQEGGDGAFNTEAFTPGIREDAEHLNEEI